VSATAAPREAQTQTAAELSERIAAAAAHRDELSRRRDALEERIEAADQSLGRAYASGEDGSVISAQIAELQVQLRGVTRAIPIMEGEIADLERDHSKAVEREAADRQARTIATAVSAARELDAALSAWMETYRPALNRLNAHLRTAERAERALCELRGSHVPAEATAYRQARIAHPELFKFIYALSTIGIKPGEA
jgi:chromosome segregation ATPase